MKKVRTSLALLAFIMAIGASFAFRPMPNITVYEFIPGDQPACDSHSAPCGSGTKACTLSGISTTLRSTDVVANSCGAEQKMP